MTDSRIGPDGTRPRLPPRAAQARRRDVRRRCRRGRSRGRRDRRPADRRGGGHRRPGRGGHRRRQLLPRRRAAAARHGPGPGRLHGHARHRDELPGAAGLPGARAPHRHPRADRHHDGPGRRGLHPAARHPAPGEGPRGDLRRRGRHAVLLHRHRRARSARWRSAPRSCCWPRAWTGSTPPTPRSTRRQAATTRSPTARCSSRG